MAAIRVPPSVTETLIEDMTSMLAVVRAARHLKLGDLSGYAALKLALAGLDTPYRIGDTP